MSNITIKTSLFGIGSLFLYLAEIKEEERLVVLFQDPFFTKDIFKKYIRSRKSSLKEKNEFSALSDIKGGIYNNFIYLDFPSDFSKTKFRTLGQLFGILPKDALKKNILKSLIRFCEQMHGNGDIIGNLSPELFFIDNDGTPFNYGLYIGYDNVEISKDLIKMKSQLNNFLSPEHFKGEDITIKSDIYSLALSIIYLYSQKTYTKDEIIGNNIHIPDELKDYKEILQMMLLQEPAKRPDIKTVYLAFTSDVLPVHFTYYDSNKIADGVCAKCQKPILLADAQKIGNDYFCNECIEKIANKSNEAEEEIKEDVHYCKYHKKRIASYQCEVCGAYLCDDCVEEIDGHYFCPEDAIEKRKEIDREKSQVFRANITKEKEKREKQNQIKEEIPDDFVNEDSGSEFDYTEPSQTNVPENKETTSYHHNDFAEEDTMETVSENLSNIDKNEIEENKKTKKKKNLTYFIAIAGALIVVMTLLIILFGKVGTDSKDIKKYKKLFNNSVNFEDKILYGNKITDLYLSKIKKNNKNDQNYSNAFLFLQNFLRETSNNTEKMRIYDKILEAQISNKKYKDVQQTFSEMKKIFKGDKFSYPQTLLREGRFYKQIGNKKHAKRIFRSILKQYPRTPFAKKAYLEIKKF